MPPKTGLTLLTILQAAVDIADANGIEAVTLAFLAKNLNVKSPSLYNHVDGLPGLRQKLAVYGLEQLYSVLMRAAVGRSGDEAVRAMSEAYVQFARSHPGLYDATLRPPDLRDPGVQKSAGEIVELCVRVLSVYGLEGDDAIHAVRGLRSILHGFASLQLSGGFGIPLDLDVSLGRMIDTFIAGIEKMKSV